jgi:TetR/AcrR family fatty acid metabolism transcriptional regulator
LSSYSERLLFETHFRGQLPTPAETTTRRDKRTAILDAAIRVFARTGYHAARVSDIAEEAGIAYGLVYHYFKNKEEVLNSIFEERWGDFLEVVSAIAASDKPCRDKLLSVASLIVNAYRVRPEWVKVLVLEIQRSSRFAEPGQMHAVGKLFAMIAAILREGQARGEVREDLDPKIACYVLIGGLEIVITGLVLGVIEIEPGEEDGDYFDRVARTVVEVYINGICA